MHMFVLGWGLGEISEFIRPKQTKVGLCKRKSLHHSSGKGIMASVLGPHKSAYPRFYQESDLTTAGTPGVRGMELLDLY